MLRLIFLNIQYNPHPPNTVPPIQYNTPNTVPPTFPHLFQHAVKYYTNIPCPLNTVPFCFLPRGTILEGFTVFTIFYNLYFSYNSILSNYINYYQMNFEK